MKFVALIRLFLHVYVFVPSLIFFSGGKDSMFNMMHCIAEGHEVIALGHLLPSQDELDSYMYQSVGYECIPYIAECLELPLYQEKIIGKSINKTPNI